MVIAVLLAPLLAIQTQKYLELRRQARERKLMVFKTLMSTRATPLSAYHVEALNMIDVEFYGRRKKDRNVIKAWKNYLDHLNNGPSDESKRPLWFEKINDLSTELLYEMAISLGYDFDKVHIKRGIYIPKGHTDLEMEQMAIRKGLVEVLDGERALPMRILPFAESEEEFEKQKQLREAQLEDEATMRRVFIESLTGKRPLAVKIIQDDNDSGNGV
jgi:hypothetical protein